jgi:hypothetical protein
LGVSFVVWRGVGHAHWEARFGPIRGRSVDLNSIITITEFEYMCTQHNYKFKIGCV